MRAIERRKYIIIVNSLIIAHFRRLPLFNFACMHVLLCTGLLPRPLLPAVYENQPKSLFCLCVQYNAEATWHARTVCASFMRITGILHHNRHHLHESSMQHLLSKLEQVVVKIVKARLSGLVRYVLNCICMVYCTCIYR